MVRWIMTEIPWSNVGFCAEERAEEDGSEGDDMFLFPNEGWASKLPKDPKALDRSQLAAVWLLSGCCLWLLSLAAAENPQWASAQWVVLQCGTPNGWCPLSWCALCFRFFLQVRGSGGFGLQGRKYIIEGCWKQNPVHV